MWDSYSLVVATVASPSLVRWQYVLQCAVVTSGQVYKDTAVLVVMLESGRQFTDVVGGNEVAKVVNTVEPAAAVSVFRVGCVF